MYTIEEHLKQCKFDKQYKNLVKRLKNKTVIIYGTGIMFETINSNYDLSKLNIIGVSDIKYYLGQEGDLDFGYKIIPAESIKNYDMDAILLGVQKYDDILENFYEDFLEDTARKHLINFLSEPEILKKIMCI